MTNAEFGLRSRLKQFDNTIKGKSGHGGARRFLYAYRDAGKLASELYVSVMSFDDCTVTSNEPHDLRVMGEIAKAEYECFALYVCLGLRKDKAGKHLLPKFNDKKNAPKLNQMLK